MAELGFEHGSLGLSSFSQEDPTDPAVTPEVLQEDKEGSVVFLVFRSAGRKVITKAKYAVPLFLSPLIFPEGPGFTF